MYNEYGEHNRAEWSLREKFFRTGLYRFSNNCVDKILGYVVWGSFWNLLLIYPDCSLRLKINACSGGDRPGARAAVPLNLRVSHPKTTVHRGQSADATQLWPRHLTGRPSSSRSGQQVIAIVTESELNTLHAL